MTNYGDTNYNETSKLGNNAEQQAIVERQRIWQEQVEFPVTKFNIDEKACVHIVSFEVNGRAFQGQGNTVQKAIMAAINNRKNINNSIFGIRGLLGTMDRAGIKEITSDEDQTCVTAVYDYVEFVGQSKYINKDFAHCQAAVEACGQVARLVFRSRSVNQNHNKSQTKFTN